MGILKNQLIIVLILQKKSFKIDKVVFTTQKLPIFNLKYPVSHYFTIKDFHDYFGDKYYGKKLINFRLKIILINLKKIKEITKIFTCFKKVSENMILILRKIEICKQIFLLKQSKGSIKNIKFYDHHSCHVAYAYFFQQKKD